MFRFFILFFYFSLSRFFSLLLFYYNQRSRHSRVPFSLVFFFYSKCYVVFITQAYAQKSTRGTLGLLVPFEVGVRGGGYRTPRPPARNSGRTTSICSRLILERETIDRPVINRYNFSPLLVSRNYYPVWRCVFATA